MFLLHQIVPASSDMFQTEKVPQMVGREADQISEK